MKVFNLACEHGHHFEGWFSAANDFDSQSKSGLIECPMCSSKVVTKLLSAPRLNLSAHAEPGAVKQKALDAQDVSSLWLKMARHMIQNSEDVGERFADEARRIHYSEAPTRNIRGTASSEQASELAEEGIEVFAFPMPKALKEPLQ
jgi:hypothetical protein